jgi:hypothetical protein
MELEPIKIEQISREEALKNCESCARNMPHLHFYVEGKTNKYKSFEDCLVHTRDEMVEYANVCADQFPQEFHSFNGGKSQSEFLKSENVRAAAEKVWEADNYTLSAESVACHSLDDENIINICCDENFKGFIKT